MFAAVHESGYGTKAKSTMSAPTSALGGKADVLRTSAEVRVDPQQKWANWSGRICGSIEWQLCDRPRSRQLAEHGIVKTGNCQEAIDRERRFEGQNALSLQLRFSNPLTS